MNATASTNSAVPTIHNRNSPRRQFIVQPILDPASHDLADSTHQDKDKAAPTPPIIAMLPFEEEQDTNNGQQQANGVGKQLNQLIGRERHPSEPWQYRGGQSRYSEANVPSWYAQSTVVAGGRARSLGCGCGSPRRDGGRGAATSEQNVKFQQPHSNQRRASQSHSGGTKDPARV